MPQKTTIDPTQRSLEAAILDQKIAGKFDDKPYAYVPVISEGPKQWEIGIAVKHEQATAQSRAASNSTSTRKLMHSSDGMNMHIGLDPARAMKIIASSMSQQAKY